MRFAREDLKIDPRVGFLATAPGLLAPAAPTPLEAPLDTRDERPGSGMMDDRRELPLPVSEKVALGFGDSGAFADERAVSKTSFKNLFLVEANRVKCSSGTVSLFFSINPSTSYVTSTA